MQQSIFPINRLQSIPTPFYFYDDLLLEKTISEINRCIEGAPIHVHYALKANANPKIVSILQRNGFGVDCVSGGEIKLALEAGFDPEKIVFAGVAKSDDEILFALQSKILCFNVESLEELSIIDNLCANHGYTANVCLRINPNIDAHTHKYITTGLEENKFGIGIDQLPDALTLLKSLSNVSLIGLHFHIGSQITILQPFILLCNRINAIVQDIESKGFNIRIINVGGGLGIDYYNPDKNPISDFSGYFNVFKTHLKLTPHMQMHCELGRSVVAQCGTIITRVLYVKHGITKQFIMVDAGMNNLIRPALYQAHHAIQNLTSTALKQEVYDVVGPICESADVFGTEVILPTTSRGDLMAIRSAGAYGEVMASTYNCRPFAKSYFITELD
ncbi:MAG: diaminopimelate decarboxylase [Muribaculaceae bacterium]|nr:diaminopimelate decarboxylase [Muribaculaceae bacterium]